MKLTNIKIIEEPVKSKCTIGELEPLTVFRCKNKILMKVDHWNHNIMWLGGEAPLSMSPGLIDSISNSLIVDEIYQTEIKITKC